MLHCRGRIFKLALQDSVATLGRQATAWQQVLRNRSCCFPFNLLQMCFSLSLDQLLASAGDQQKFQAVLSSVGSKSTMFTLIQEAKAQSEVSGHRNGRAVLEGLSLAAMEVSPAALLSSPSTPWTSLQGSRRPTVLLCTSVLSSVAIN